jgi:hypothetical protein
MPESGSKSNIKRGITTESLPTGGPLGGGRPPRSLQLKNYDKALNLLDNNIEEALNVLINGLRDDDKYFRFNCACVLIKKVLPDKKSKEISTPNNKPISLEITDKRKLVDNIVKIIDGMSLEDVKNATGKKIFNMSQETDYYFEEEREQKQELNGITGISEVVAGREGEAEGNVEERASTDKGREGSKEDTFGRKGAESSVSSEEGF